MTKNYSSEASQPSLMELLIASYTTGRVLYVAAKLEIADLIAQSPKTADELAHETKCYPPWLNRVLLMLASIGIFAADDDGRFHLTPRGEFLRREHPQSQRSFAIMCGSSFFGDHGESFMRRCSPGNQLSNGFTPNHYFDTCRNILIKLHSLTTG